MILFGYSVYRALYRPPTYGSGTLAVIVSFSLMMTASYFEVNHHYMQNKADRAAHAITNDKSIKVKCQRPSSALFDAQVGVKGTVFWDDFSTIHLKMSTCRDLKSYAWSKDKDNPTRDQIIAVHVLTHEVMHTQKITSESEAECYAMYYDPQTFMHYGASPQAAAELTEWYRANIYPHMPDNYTSLDCSTLIYP